VVEGAVECRATSSGFQRARRVHTVLGTPMGNARSGEEEVVVEVEDSLFAEAPPSGRFPTSLYGTPLSRIPQPQEHIRQRPMALAQWPQRASGRTTTTNLFQSSRSQN
jgi:hypothetical protein